MLETPAEIDRLQRLLDDSYDRAGAHLRSVIDPARRMRAEEVVAEMTGMCLLAIGTVTADGRPLTAPVDGYLIHGEVHFSLGRQAVRARHLARRPRCSATWLPGIERAVTVHGTAELYDALDPHRAELKQAMLDHYLPQQGEAFRTWLDGASPLGVRIQPERIFSFAMR